VRRSTRGILTRNECYSTQFSAIVSKIARRSLELSLDQRREISVTLYVDLPTLKYLLLLLLYKVRYAQSLELYDVMRSRVPRCTVIAFQCAPSSAAQQRLIKYEISFTGGKVLTEASKSIRSWQINAARDISFSRTYDTLIRRIRSYCVCTGPLGNRTYASTCLSTSM